MFENARHCMTAGVAPMQRVDSRPLATAALLAVALVTGCATFPGGPTAPGRESAPAPAASTHARDPSPPANVNLSGYPLAFRQGYADGCASSRQGGEQRDATRWGTDAQYRQGWTDGHAICGKRPR